jgi:hypothetical protein
MRAVNIQAVNWLVVTAIYHQQSALMSVVRYGLYNGVKFKLITCWRCDLPLYHGFINPWLASYHS